MLQGSGPLRLNALTQAPMIAALGRSEQRALVRLLSASASSAQAKPRGTTTTFVGLNASTPFGQRRLMALRSAGHGGHNAMLAPLVRFQHTQEHHRSTPSGDADAIGFGAGKSATSSSQARNPPVYQKAQPLSQNASKQPAPTSDITRVLPVLDMAGGEKGSADNQTTTALSQMAEKQALEKAKADAEAQRLAEMGVVKRTWEKVKEEAQHYWHGTKLLGKEIKISSRLLRRLLLGYSLTRREHRQLKRTMADLLRLIPFAPFIIIPFGELLLPVAIKIFPNMLPSTFESKFAAEEKRRGLIKVRLEMAKFLQGTIREGGIQATDKVKTSDEFKEFFRKVRATGEKPSAQDIVKFAKLFDDDLTLDNLTRPQLVSMCRYMQINAFGTDNYLRYQIRTKLNRIRRDDIVIQHEGLDKMTQHELQSACQSRGIQTFGSDEDRLRDELRQWIELHITQRISGTLLVLSKAFNYMSPGEDERSTSQLKSLELTLSSLPDNLINEAELNVSKDAATNKQRLEVLQQQEELIEDEAEQEAAEEEARKVEKRRKDAEKARVAKEEEDAKALLPRSETEARKEKQEDSESDELRMTNEQLTELGEALSLLSAKSSVLKEREELAQLIKEVSSVPEEDVGTHISPETAQKVTEQSQAGQASEEEQAAHEAAASTSQSAASRSLAKRVRSMLEKIDEQLEAYEEEVGSKMHIIEASPSGKISVDDLEQALRLIKHRPSDDVLERLVDSMDKDKDGLIPLQEVVALAQQEIGLGIVREDSIKDIAGQGRKLGDEMRAGRKDDQDRSEGEGGGNGEGEGEGKATSQGQGQERKNGSRSEGESKDQLRREDIVKD
ncbi:unnamed protein product [Parajaminaea phylloscopi]